MQRVSPGGTLQGDVSVSAPRTDVRLDEEQEVEREGLLQCLDGEVDVRLDGVDREPHLRRHLVVVLVLVVDFAEDLVAARRQLADGIVYLLQAFEVGQGLLDTGVCGRGSLRLGQLHMFVPVTQVVACGVAGADKEVGRRTVEQLPLLQQPTGAFLVLGIVIAIIAVIVNFRSKQANRLLARTMTPNSIKHKAMQAEGKYHGQNTPGTDSGVSHHKKENNTAMPAK